MSLPDHELSSEVVRGTYIPPGNFGSQTPLYDWEKGGIAIQDTSKGLMYQNWLGYFDLVTHKAFIKGTTTEQTVELITDLRDIKAFSFAFDQNMRWVAALLDSAGELKFHWYDTETASYTVTTFTGITTVKVALDDKRPERTAESDVILTYINTSNTLMAREQRDRYEIEYQLQTDLPDELIITNFAMTRKLRMQWRMRFKILGE